MTQTQHAYQTKKKHINCFVATAASQAYDAGFSRCCCIIYVIKFYKVAKKKCPSSVCITHNFTAFYNVLMCVLMIFKWHLVQYFISSIRKVFLSKDWPWNDDKASKQSITYQLDRHFVIYCHYCHFKQWNHCLNVFICKTS